MNSNNGERVFTARDIIPVRAGGISLVYGLSDGCAVESFPWHGYQDDSEGSAMHGLASQARRISRRQDIRAVTFAPAGADVSVQALGLSLAFADHLSSVRARSGMDRTCVTCPVAPGIESSDLTRLPHLVAFGLNGKVTDTVVWELVETEYALSWLGMPLPAERFEGHLCHLLEFRRSARLGRLPQTEDGNKLRKLLSHRYLSIK